MKSHEIEKQLKKEAETNAPDIYDRIVLAAQAECLSLPKAKRKDPARNKEYAKPKRRKLTLAFFTSFAAVAACLAITLPIALKGVTGNPPSPVRHIYINLLFILMQKNPQIPPFTAVS